MTRGFRDEDEAKPFDDGDDKITVEGATAIGESERALLVEFGDQRTWVPKSCIHDDSEVFDTKEHGQGKLIVKGWFARGPGAKAFRAYVT